jgi:hypothetical protein
VLLVVDHPRREPLFEQMALSAVPSIEPLGVDAEQAVHREGELLLAALDNEVEVRSEQTPCVQAESEALDRLLEQSRECGSIGVVDEDERAARSARRDVEVAVVEVEAGATRHRSIDASGVASGRPAIVTVSSQGLSLGLVR